MNPKRKQALIQEGYRIGMQQVLPELQGFLAFLRSRGVANWLIIGGQEWGLAFVLGYYLRPGLRILIDANDQEERTQMLQSVPGYVRELVMDAHVETTLQAVEEALAGAQLDLLFLAGDTSYAGTRSKYNQYKRFVRDGGVIAFNAIRDCPFYAQQGIATPCLWKDVKNALPPAQWQEFLASPEDCMLPQGNWGRAVAIAERHGISHEWGGIGAIIVKARKPVATAADIELHNRDSALGRPARHPFLVYIPTDGGDYIADIDDNERLFDVALNNYSTTAHIPEGEAEWQFAVEGHKWPSIATNLKKITKAYDYVAFIDNDIAVATHQLNMLFLAGSALRLDLYQAALSRDSVTAWPQLKHVSGSLARRIDFVEIMMPIFSSRALEICAPTFNLSTSGWGLDILWAKLLQDSNIGVIDAVIVGHRRPVVSHAWRNADGLSAEEELARIRQSFNI